MKTAVGLKSPSIITANSSSVHPRSGTTTVLNTLFLMQTHDWLPKWPLLPSAVSQKSSVINMCLLAAADQFCASEEKQIATVLRSTMCCDANTPQHAVAAKPESRSLGITAWAQEYEPANTTDDRQSSHRPSAMTASCMFPTRIYHSIHSTITYRQLRFLALPLQRN